MIWHPKDSISRTRDSHEGIVRLLTIKLTALVIGLVSNLAELFQRGLLDRIHVHDLFAMFGDRFCILRAFEHFSLWSISVFENFRLFEKDFPASLDQTRLLYLCGKGTCKNTYDGSLLKKKESNGGYGSCMVGDIIVIPEEGPTVDHVEGRWEGCESFVNGEEAIRLGLRNHVHTVGCSSVGSGSSSGNRLLARDFSLEIPCFSPSAHERGSLYTRTACVDGGSTRENGSSTRAMDRLYIILIVLEKFTPLRSLIPGNARGAFHSPFAEGFSAAYARDLKRPFHGEENQRSSSNGQTRIDSRRGESVHVALPPRLVDPSPGAGSRFRRVPRARRSTERSSGVEGKEARPLGPSLPPSRHAQLEKACLRATTCSGSRTALGTTSTRARSRAQ